MTDIYSIQMEYMTITFNTHYDNLDFDNLFVNNRSYYSSGEGQYHINIIDFNGEICTEFDYTKIHNFLYQIYEGSKRGWGGYIGGYSHSHHIVIVVRNSKYMVVHYGTDDEPSGSHFTLKSEVFDSFGELWSMLREEEKSAILEKYLNEMSTNIFDRK